MPPTIINFGSLNIDHVYAVPHITTPGETIASASLATFAGGKGLNQSIALARAGASVYHAGIIGREGSFLMTLLKESGADTRFILRQDAVPTGHAMIQVDKDGQNSIVLYQGANHCFTAEYIDSVFARTKGGGLVLLQNETNLTSYIITSAKKNGFTLAFNPSPFHDSLLDLPFHEVDILIFNEIEGEQLSGQKKPDAILNQLREKYPNMALLLTLGSKGSIYMTGSKIYRQGIYETKVVDTTAAGDTFTGFFLTGLLMKMAPDEILRYATVASGLAVSQKGAAASIPSAGMVQSAMNEI